MYQAQPILTRPQGMKMKYIKVFLMVLFIALTNVAPVAASGSADGIDWLYEQSTEMARVIVAGISVAFGVGFLLNLVRAQLARGTGDALGYSRALQQGLGMVILLALAANIVPLSDGLRQIGTGIDANPGSPADLYAVWEALARFFISALLGGAGIYTTVSAIGSGMAGHLATITGSPTGVSRVLSNGVILIGGGLLTILSVIIAGSMLDVVFK